MITLNVDDIIYKILENVTNVYEGWYRESLEATHTTFFCYMDGENLSDDEPEDIVLNFQFDTWGEKKEEVDKQRKKVRKLLKENDFILTDNRNDFEGETGIYHYADKFSFIVDAEEYYLE